MTTGASPHGYGSRTVTRAAAVARAWWVEILAIVLGGVGFVEGLANPTGSDGISKGPEWLVPLIAPAMAVPLLFQRRAPFAAPVATVAIAVAATFIGSGQAVSDSISPFFLLFVAAWLFGQLDRRSAVIGLLLLYLGTIVVNVEGDQNTVSNFFFPALFFTFFWGGSAFLKAREEGFREAEERARRIALANETEAMRAVAEERQRIARELHDVIAHSVSVMTVQAGAVRRLLLPEQERERQALETVEATGRQALTEMRRLVGLAARAGRDARVRAPAVDEDARRARRHGQGGGAARRARRRGRAARPPARHRPLRLPRRPGGAHERAQVRRPRPRLGDGALAGAGARARDRERRPLWLRVGATAAATASPA